MKGNGYFVMAYYRGNHALHAYPVFYSTDLDEAIEAAKRQANYRGGKYSCVVYEMKDGSYDEDCQYSKFSHIMVVYEAKTAYPIEP